ncbi:unnamed protein product [Litomosoides sigmodontis]|uniref:Uncharacterized protein n=1 Tax=Litomosoides sigmodontis TaxID=42156 RepID=A0A3P6SGW9_LITSI|nr:unnamed protein product [Litomosoides sigmodontis]
MKVLANEYGYGDDDNRQVMFYQSSGQNQHISGNSSEKSKYSKHPLVENIVEGEDMLELMLSPEFAPFISEEFNEKQISRKSRKQVWILISRIEIKNGAWSIGAAEKTTWWFDQVEQK